MTAIVRAIDVGRGNTKFVTGHDGDNITCMHFASEAYPSEVEHAYDGVTTKRNTVRVPADNLYYEVGPDVALAADVFNAKVLQRDDYFEAPEYLALVRGALHYMSVDAIDLLVVGVPVAAFKVPQLATRLERRLTGIHPIGNARPVTVRSVRVLAQPTGALMTFGKALGRLGEMSKERSLIIDPGAQTFDWIVTEGMGLVGNKSHSLNRGMFDVCQKIAEGISRNTHMEYRDFDAIDINESFDCQQRRKAQRMIHHHW